MQLAKNNSNRMHEAMTNFETVGRNMNATQQSYANKQSTIADKPNRIDFYKSNHAAPPVP